MMAPIPISGMCRVGVCTVGVCRVGVCIVGVCRVGVWVVCPAGASPWLLLQAGAHRHGPGVHHVRSDLRHLLRGDQPRDRLQHGQVGLAESAASAVTVAVPV